MQNARKMIASLRKPFGAHGRVYGLDSFGFSAPYKVLDEKLGYTAENIRKEVLAFLK